MGMAIDLVALIGKHTRLKWAARGANGDEYAGPCPFCGGTDRFRVWPDHLGGPRWACLDHNAVPSRNGCGRSGDAIAFQVEIGKLTPQEAGRMRREERGGVGAAVIGGKARARPRPEPVKPSPVYHPCKPAPPVAWQEQARVFVNYCAEELFNAAGRVGLDWLHSRGLTDDTIRTWRLGWHDRDRWRDPSKWGLDGGSKVWLPRGVLIPWTVAGAVWHIKTRRFGADGPLTTTDKYAQVRDGRPTLYGLDLLTGQRPAVVICEGELDAPLLWQKAGDLVDVVAIGSKGTRVPLEYLTRLLTHRRWLIALDADADQEAGDWLGYAPRARRARPLQGDDVTDFHQKGGNLRVWIKFFLWRHGDAGEGAGVFGECGK